MALLRPSCLTSIFSPRRNAAGGRRSERGAALTEYGLIGATVLLVAVGAIDLLTDESGSYLEATGSDIGTPRDFAADINPDLPVPPSWLTQPPPPTTTTTVASTTTTTTIAASTTTTSTPAAGITYGPNLITTGGFETPNIGGVNWTLTEASPWQSTASGNRIEIWTSGFNGVTAYGGTQLAELNVSGPTTYTQTLTLEVGKTYQWSFAHRGRVNDDTLEVLIDGAVVDTKTSSPGAWQLYEGTFVATSTSMTVGLRAVDSGGSGNLIDEFQVREVITTPATTTTTAAPTTTTTAPTTTTAVSYPTGSVLLVGPMRSQSNLNRCFQVRNPGVIGSTIRRQNCDGGNDQNVEAVGSGVTVAFQFTDTPNAGLCVTIDPNDNDRLVMDTCDGSTGQLFTYTDIGSGYYSFASNLTSECVRYDNTLRMASCRDRSNRRFTFN